MARKISDLQKGLIELEISKSVKRIQHEFNLSRENLGVRRFTEGDVARAIMLFLKIKYNIELTEIF